MDILEYRGVSYPRCAKCEYCETSVLLSFTDVTVRDFRPLTGEYTQEHHIWTCPVCGNEHIIEGRCKD